MKSHLSTMCAHPSSLTMHNLSPLLVFLACIIWTENGYRFSSIVRKVKCFSIHLQEGYETFHAPTWGLWDKQGFFLEVSDVADNHPDDLARFGYILDMKVRKKPEFFYIYSWLHTGTHHKICRFEFVFIENLANSGHFFHEKSVVYRSTSYFSGRNLA